MINFNNANDIPTQMDDNIQDIPTPIVVADKVQDSPITKDELERIAEIRLKRFAQNVQTIPMTVNDEVQKIVSITKEDKEKIAEICLRRSAKKKIRLS